MEKKNKKKEVVSVGSCILARDHNIGVCDVVVSNIFAYPSKREGGKRRYSGA